MGLHPENSVSTAGPGTSLPQISRDYCYGWMDRGVCVCVCVCVCVK